MQAKACYHLPGQALQVLNLFVLFLHREQIPAQLTAAPRRTQIGPLWVKLDQRSRKRRGGRCLGAFPELAPEVWCQARTSPRE